MELTSANKQICLDKGVTSSFKTKIKKYFIRIFLLIPANMVDKSIVRCVEERFGQILKYSKSNITMHIISKIDTDCQYCHYINDSFYYTVRRVKTLLKSFSVRYVATKMFIIKHLTFFASSSLSLYS